MNLFDLYLGGVLAILGLALAVSRAPGRPLTWRFVILTAGLWPVVIPLLLAFPGAAPKNRFRA